MPARHRAEPVTRMLGALCAALDPRPRPHQAQQANAAHNPALLIGVSGLTRAGQPVPALRAGQVAGPDLPGLRFERYVDDVVIHCVSRWQAEAVRTAIGGRLAEVGLRLHPAKTRLVYCKDSNRRGSHEYTSFTFLGYTFRPRRARNSKTGQLFTAFGPAMSTDAVKAKSGEVRSWRLHLRTNLTLDSLARIINPIVRGWMQYWGRYHRHVMHPLLQRINAYLMRWAQRKYKRLRAIKRAKAWWVGVTRRDPTLFAHWAWTHNFWMAG
jgi:RNA-directed DNA polymerase